MAEQLPYRHMARPVDDADAFPEPPPGIVLAPFDPARDAAELYAVLAPTYDEVDDGMVLAPFEQWLSALLADEDYCREAIFLARSNEGEVAGIVINWRNGFVYDLAVAPGWRKRGIAEFLLRHSFAHFAAAGVERVELKVTRGNPTGAERLYERLGFIDLPPENPPAIET